MRRKTRQEKLSERIIERLKHIEKEMLASANELSDAEYQALSREAIKLREMLSTM